jgi:cytochrome oxidase Cu insertion factor (SCO1/SenC/PrrC family)
VYIIQRARRFNPSPEKLAAYAKEHELDATWKLLLDSKLVATRAFGAQRKLIKRPDGSVSIRHTATIYLTDRSMHIRAAFDEKDSSESTSDCIEKESKSPCASPAPAGKAARR